MCLGHIEQKFQTIKTDWSAQDFWEWWKKRYTLQNTASKWATITSIDELTYAMCKNMAEYRSKYYTLKAIEEEDTRIKADHRTSANFASTKSSTRLQGGAAKEKKEFIEWPKCRKCGCKH